MLRVVLLLGTNLAVLVLIGIITRVLGLDNYLHRHGMNYSALLVYAGLFGMGGAFFSLMISKWMAKMSTGAQVIDQPRNPNEAWLFDTVRRHAEAAGIAMPEVAVYEGPEMNAFATGASKNSSLVAVSTGLLQNMDRRQIDAVLGHEIAHIANGDMVTLTLIQGVLNTFVIFLARVVGSIVDGALRGNREGEGGGIAYFAIVMVLQVVLGIGATLIVMWFSRWREFRADAGGARLAGRENMISALQRLGMGHGETTLPQEVQAFGISGNFGKLFSSHPPIEERIAALRAAA